MWLCARDYKPRCKCCFFTFFSIRIPIAKPFILYWRVSMRVCVCEWVSINRQKIISFSPAKYSVLCVMCERFFSIWWGRFHLYRLLLFFAISIGISANIIVTLNYYSMRSSMRTTFLLYFIHLSSFMPVNIRICRFSNGLFGSYFFVVHLSVEQFQKRTGKQASILGRIERRIHTRTRINVRIE